jgi:exopolysaccharide biosynthesis WecB/TagA/CpsF family protein
LTARKQIHKVDVLGVDFAVVDYESASEVIIDAAEKHRSFSVFALPVHGIIENYTDPQMRAATGGADLIVPDGQPVRWCMNHFHNARLTHRVYGPTLSLHLLKKANELKLRVFLYGGKSEHTLTKFSAFIHARYPDVIVCGTYREGQPEGDSLTADMVNAKHPHLVLVGRGCPFQEKWIAKQHGKIHAAMIGVGAAFSFHAGETPQAPRWMQDRGLEWLHRLMQEPRRLWKRFLFTNSLFIFLIFQKKLGRDI